MKDLSEAAGRERASKEKAVEAAKEKMKIAESAKKRATAAEKLWVSAKKKSTEPAMQQNETETKLAETASLNSALSEEVVDLRATLEACENKWYNEGFADAEKSVEPVVIQARELSFQEGWMAALQALGVPEDSSLRDPNQIPVPVSVPVALNSAGPNEEEESDSLRELVEQIDAHVEMIRAEVTSNPPTEVPQDEDAHSQPPVPERHAVEIASETQPAELSS